MSRKEVPVLEPQVETVTTEETQLCPPWKVILHDDDVTTQEFVVRLLVGLFGKALPDAVDLMLEVHEEGAAVICVCARERAELYVEQVHSLARAQKYPLMASCEPEG